jgi:hypothetical protein
MPRLLQEFAERHCPAGGHPHGEEIGLQRTRRWGDRAGGENVGFCGVRSALSKPSDALDLRRRERRKNLVTAIFD